MADDEKVTDIQKERKKKKPGKIDRVDLKTKIEEINKEFSVIQRGSQVLIMRHWINEKGKSRLAFFRRPDFLLFMENRRISVENDDGEKVLKPLAPLWLASQLRAQYDEVYFEPEGEESETRYNLWQGFAFKPDKDAGGFDKFIDHIKTNICQNDPSLFEWVMAWLADLIQNPANKSGTALILRGEMGIGKGQFAYHIGRLLGVHYMTVSQSSQITGKFNGHLADKILIFMDESFWDDKKQGAGVFRALVTESCITIEMKGRDAVMVDNFTRVVAAANSDWIVPVGFKDERRMAVLDVGSLCIGNVEYFAAIDEQLKAHNDGGYKALLYYLKNYKYDKRLPRTIPVTNALLDQKKYSLPPHVKWWFNCLQNQSVIDIDKKIENWPDKISTRQFYTSYINWCKVMNIKEVLDESWLPRRLGNWCKLRKQRIKGDDTYYCLDTLQEAQDTFDEQIGHSIDWNDGETIAGDVDSTRNDGYHTL